MFTNQLLLGTVVMLVLCQLTLAQPSQRVIVELNQFLTTDEKVVLKKEIETMLEQEIKLAELSNSTRWVLVIQHPLSSQVLSEFIKKLQALSQISYVEADQLFSTQ